LLDGPEDKSDWRILFLSEKFFQVSVKSLQIIELEAGPPSVEYQPFDRVGAPFGQGVFFDRDHALGCRLLIGGSFNIFIGLFFAAGLPFGIGLLIASRFPKACRDLTDSGFQS